MQSPKFKRPRKVSITSSLHRPFRFGPAVYRSRPTVWWHCRHALCPLVNNTANRHASAGRGEVRDTLTRILPAVFRVFVRFSSFWLDFRLSTFFHVTCVEKTSQKTLRSKWIVIQHYVRSYGSAVINGGQPTAAVAARLSPRGKCQTRPATTSHL